VVIPREVYRVFRHEDTSWLTLMTCQDYQPSSGLYLHRLVVRAVLIQITNH